MKFEKSLYPEGTDRKESLQESEERIAQFEKNERGKPYGKSEYTQLDSPLDFFEGEYYHGSFNETFKTVLPKGEKSLKSYIESVFSSRAGEAIGVEFGGLGLALFTGFKKGIFKKTVAVTLVDNRTEFDRFAQKIINKNQGYDHEVVEGNMLKTPLYEKIKKEVGGQKVDFIIERMLNGLMLLPFEPYALTKVLGRWYEMLREGGVMFVQVPKFFNELGVEWVEMLNKKYAGQLEAQFHLSVTQDTNSMNATVFRLRKLKGAPEKLPVFDPRKVHEIGMATGKKIIEEHFS